MISVAVDWKPTALGEFRFPFFDRAAKTSRVAGQWGACFSVCLFKFAPQGRQFPRRKHR